MTLNFDPPALNSARTAPGPGALSGYPWRPSNHWKPRPLTSAARAQYVASRMEFVEGGVGGGGGSNSGAEPGLSPAMDVAFIAARLARRPGDGGVGGRVGEAGRRGGGGGRRDKSKGASEIGVEAGGQIGREDSGRETGRNGGGGGGRTSGEGRGGGGGTGGDGGGGGEGTSYTGTYREIQKRGDSGRKANHTNIGHEDNVAYNSRGERVRPGSRERRIHKQSGERMTQKESGGEQEVQFAKRNGEAETNGGYRERDGELQGTPGREAAAAATPRRGSGTVQGHSYKVPLRPSVLTFGNNGSERDVRANRPRSNSADHRSPRSSYGRSTGSPYLEDQYNLVLANSQTPHLQPHDPQRKRTSGERRRSQSDDDVRKPRGTIRHTHSDDDVMKGSKVRNQPKDDVRSTADRIGRCDPETANPAPFYKAALALMQAQRQRASSGLVRIPPSTSPKGSVSPQQQPQLKYNFYHRQYQWTRDTHRPQQQHMHHYQQQPHSGHQPQYGNMNPQYTSSQPTKSILRQTPSPVSREGSSLYHPHPHYSPRSFLSVLPVSDTRTRASSGSRHAAPAGVTRSLRMMSRKKVTFGDDVVVQLQRDAGVTSRVLSHSLT